MFVRFEQRSENQGQAKKQTDNSFFGTQGVVAQVTAQIIQ